MDAARAREIVTAVVRRWRRDYDVTDDAACDVLDERLGEALADALDDTAVWIPEAPEFPGTYANCSDTTGGGKIRGAGPLQPATMIAERALHFATREACLRWCRANPDPVFVPMAHVFTGPRTAARVRAQIDAERAEGRG